MRTRHILGCSIAVLLLLASATAWAQGAGEAATPANDLGLVLGDGYTIRAEQHGAVQRFTGSLVKLNDRWIVLHSVSDGRHEFSALSKLPLVGRTMFRKADAGHTDEYLWIPREAAAVEKRTPSAQPPAAAPILGDAPAVRTLCAIEVAVGDKVVRHQGGLEAIKGERYTVAVPKKIAAKQSTTAVMTLTASRTRREETRYDLHQHARADILCVRIPNYDPAVLLGHTP